MLPFSVITILPCLLIGAAVIAGGAWAWGALVYMTALVATMDRLIAANARNADPGAEFPASHALLLILGIAHFAVMVLAIWGVAGPSGLNVAERVALGAGTGLIFGQISHPVAHELIHKQHRALRWLGMWIYTSLLVGHHASAHLLIHHVHVGSDRDPNSAPRGETFYRYMLRVTRQSFTAALATENLRRDRAAKAAITHPFILYVGGGALICGGIGIGFGALGLAAFLSIAMHAQIQILMSDYVQHYGLRRATLPDGRLEPVGYAHSWNAPDLFSSFLMLNAPRHSDHHVAPHRAFPALQIDPDDMPFLPYPLPIMGVIALWPRTWFRVMNPLCDHWQKDPATGGRSQPTGRPCGRNSDGQAGPHLARSRHAKLSSSVLSAGSHLSG